MSTHPEYVALILLFGVAFMLMVLVTRRLEWQAALALVETRDRLINVRDALAMRMDAGGSSYHPNLSPEINALVDRLGSSSETVDMREVKVGQLVRVVFDTPLEDHMECVFVVDQPADQDVFHGGKRSEGRIVFVQLTKEVERYFKIGHGGVPAPGHMVQISGGCSWNPGTPMGCTMLHVEHIDRGRDLLWYIGGNRVLFNLPVKSIFVYTPEEPIEVPELVEWEYNPNIISTREEEVVPENRVREFFVRTSTSVYWIHESEEGPLSPPVAEKIGLVDTGSAVGVGEKMNPSVYIGITKNWFICYNSESRVSPEKVPGWAIQANSSPICGVFLDRGEAMSTLRGEYESWDERLAVSTKKALMAISGHPRFVVSEKLLK